MNLIFVFERYGLSTRFVKPRDFAPDACFDGWLDHSALAMFPLDA